LKETDLSATPPPPGSPPSRPGEPAAAQKAPAAPGGGNEPSSPFLTGSVAEQLLHLPLDGNVDLAKTYQECLQLAQAAKLPPALQAEFMEAASEVIRRLLRYGGERANCTLSALSRSARIEWGALRGRLSSDSAPIYIGPLPNRAIPAPAEREATTSIAGWRWFPREGLSRIVLVSQPHPREKEAGDMSLVVRRENKLRLVVADGLGHGPAAREAARRAIEALRRDVHLDVGEAVYAAHTHVAGTRGATLGVADIDLQARTVRSTTVGNVRVVLFYGVGRLWSPCGSDAVLGHGRGSGGQIEIRVEQHPLPENAIVCLFSDGLASQLRLPWQRVDLDDLAVQLFQTFVVPNDDATLLLAS